MNNLNQLKADKAPILLSSTPQEQIIDHQKVIETLWRKNAECSFNIKDVNSKLLELQKDLDEKLFTRRLGADTLTLNSEYSGTPTGIGTIYYDPHDKTISAILENSTLQIGQESYILCLNKTESTITNGSVVFINGAQGNRPTIALADADNYDDSTRVIGVATHDILKNEEGMITISGLVRDLSTSSLTEGNKLYVSTTPGQFTESIPANGKARVIIGYVVKSHASDGWICVKVENDKYMFGDPQNGNHSVFEDDGTLVHKGNSRTHEDLNFDVLNSGGNPTTIPDYVLVNDIPYREFTSSNNQTCGGTKEIPHAAYLSGQTLVPHLHCFLKGGEASGTTGVTFTLYWDLRQTTGVTSGNITVSATSAQLVANPYKLDLYAVSGFACSTELGGQLGMRLARTAGNAGDVIATTYGVHVEYDMLGSRSASTK